MAKTPSNMLLLLGGSFNPPHNGHLRVAIETAEALRPWKTLLIPCAVPPHKPECSLLPFALRCAMLRAAIADMTPQQAGRKALRLEVCEVESERPGPSYTVDTLAVLAERFPGKRPAFVMGGEDFTQVAGWKRGLDLPLLADLVVLARGERGRESFCANSVGFWPEARAMAPPCGVEAAFALPHGGRLLYLAQPLLDISSSLVRERLLAGRSLDFLVPPGVLRLLHGHRDAVSGLCGQE